ncbi:MAG TPA: nucleotidyl transferase AbiEii/AbiGii toxin family protein [Chitinophagales bacterium]|nr:nucleotidyl transferase AbiEii/AbiGii toxin family protein [Chitinophagales bacterium]HNM32275.1 nucleotidyl transferase AbiEii/AbiGii toxin family protein [Chitinophagales bacterium]
MLYTNTVEPNTLALLKQLMTIPELNDFYLVGGTCLSLRYGHRKSIDLDLFSVSPFENEVIVEAISKVLPLKVRNINNPVGIFGYIEDVKVDFVKQHRFPQIGVPILEDGIRMFSDKDIMAMKVNAILKRAQKKDFWDVAELLQHYTIKEFIINYEEKYPDQMLLISIPQALTYFADAEESEDPISLKAQTWESVQKIIKQNVSDYLS